MKRFLHLITILFFISGILFLKPDTVLASEGDDEHQLEMEVDGYHVSLSSQNEWGKGDNTIVVTIVDEMGMPVREAEVEILVAPQTGEHAQPESDTHAVESSHDSMSGMDMGEPEPETPSHTEESVVPLSMMESHEQGMYTVQTHLESSGEYEVQVFFHVNSEMLQADFIVEVPGTSSKTIILMSFVLINVGLIVSAGVLKSQSVTVKGK